jgi:superfamily II DNA or RNA helicase
MMYDGQIVPAEEIRNGDLVMGPDSAPRTVKGVTKGVGPLFKITPVKGDSYIVNDAHILSLKRTAEKAGDTRKGTIVNICVRDFYETNTWFRHVHKGWRAPINFQGECDLPIDPYFLGLWLGDGTSRTSGITTGDKEIVQWICGHAERIGMRISFHEQRGNCIEVNTVSHMDKPRSSSLQALMRSHNLLGNKHIPHIYKTASRENRQILLAGMLDSDGYLSKGGFEVVFKVEKLFDDLLFLARSLGFAAYKKETQKTCTNTNATGTYYRCYITGDFSEIPFLRKRHLNIPLRAQKKDHLVTGLKAEPAGLGEYFGFELEGPDRLFLLGDFTVTHNTVMTANMLGTAAERGTPSLFCVHRRELLSQSTNTFNFGGIPHGIIAPGFAPDSIHPIQIGSIQTLSRRRDRLRRPKLIVIDEAHHLAAKTWEALIEAFPDAWLIGLTATPERTDGKGLGKYFQRIIQGPSVRWLIDNNYLSPYTLYAPGAPDLRKAHTRMGDYVQAELAAEMDKPTVTGDMIRHYQKHAAGKRAILRAVSVEHSKHIAAQFCAAGIVAVHVDGDTPTNERESAMENFRAGHIKVLTNVDLFSEGVDVPTVECVIDGRPTQSLTLWLQFCGRALRYIPGKTAIILDHAGNVQRHGLPDEERVWSLEGREGRQKKSAASEVKIKLCPGCYAAQPPGGTVCRFCGTPFVVEGRAVDYVEGELQQIDPAVFKRQHVDAFKASLGAGMQPVEAAYDLANRLGGNVQELEYLLRMAKKTNKKPSWAAHVFVAKMQKRNAKKEGRV